MARSPHPEDWRWRPYQRQGPTSIHVVEESDEAKAERQRKVEEGAEVVPFGFARVIERGVNAPCSEPLTWEGDGA